MALVTGYLLTPCTSNHVRQRWQQDPQQFMRKGPCLRESHPIYPKGSALPKWFLLAYCERVMKHKPELSPIQSVQENVSSSKWMFSPEKPARMITVMAFKPEKVSKGQCWWHSGTAGLKQTLFCTSSPQQRHLHLKFSGARMETSLSLLPLGVG